MSYKYTCLATKFRKEKREGENPFQRVSPSHLQAPGLPRFVTNMRIGALQLAPNQYRFSVWAPRRRAVRLEFLRTTAEAAPLEVVRSLSMRKETRGLFTMDMDDVPAGQLYRYVLDNKLPRADPASHHQPLGVHGPSAVVDHQAHVWERIRFSPPPLNELVIYELHVGAFTPQGTFAAAITRLPHLVRLGVNAVEIMPVAQFPGGRNWGYDGVFPFAVQHSYGGPRGFKNFVDACHAHGLAVILDVVYNHLGPEGNYLRDFAPYFTKACKTPWGEALNFDGPHSDGVRAFFVQNALHWYRNYQVDGLRLDATQSIHDTRPVHLLTELAAATRDFEACSGRRILLIAESDRNDPKLALPQTHGGHGLDALWSDDFHHALHALLTGEKHGYYQDYGKLELLTRAMSHGFAYQGEYSRYRRRGHGAPPASLPPSAHVICTQNHDQVGNRMDGARLTQLVPFEVCKLAAALLLFSPGTPMLFMGEEYGETAPFLYFISHDNPALATAVREGRLRECKKFGWMNAPPDPQDPETFRQSLLDWSKLKKQRHQQLLAFYTRCIALRRRYPALHHGGGDMLTVRSDSGMQTLMLRRSFRGLHALCLYNLHPEESRLFSIDNIPSTCSWRKVLDSSEHMWGGPGGSLPEIATGTLLLPPHCAALYLVR